ncbi:KdsC family phosphatase [Yunchengibacter salinarum]|uniref:KdsC family phosphatase n=1 Tax=Yunchengibacter salinarum TaxID=3133399 RepID=UPI0035B5E5C8
MTAATGHMREGAGRPEAVAAIRLLVLDVDGVMTDGLIYYSAEGETLKAFSAQDGMAIKHGRALGLECAVVSGRQSAPLERRLADLGITAVHLSVDNKLEAVRMLARERGLTAAEVAMMGDDLIDYGAMCWAGLALAPADAAADIRDLADHVTPRGGGRGAVRDAVEYILAAQGRRLIEALDEAQLGTVHMSGGTEP